MAGDPCPIPVSLCPPVTPVAVDLCVTECSFPEDPVVLCPDGFDGFLCSGSPGADAPFGGFLLPDPAVCPDTCPDGGTGADGASAYEIAVAHGFVGTESEWLLSLVGPAGADGSGGVGSGADLVAAITAELGSSNWQTSGAAGPLEENTSIALDPSLSADGAYTGITIQGVAGATVVFGDLLSLDAATSRWKHADCTVVAGAAGDPRGQLGVALQAGVDADSITVLLSGNVRADGRFPTLTVSGAVYLSTSGGGSQSKPTASGSVIRNVGHALAENELLFAPSGMWARIL